MAGGGGEGQSRELDATPTWAVASVCAVIILISTLLEKALHHLGENFKERHRKAMYEALEKIKAELMVLGFISLLLTFGQNYIIKICIPEDAADTMLPCRKERKVEAGEAHHRRLYGIHLRELDQYIESIFHVFYSALTMALGRAKIHGWKEWEKETSSQDYEFSNDPSRFRFSHETSFVRQHTSFWNNVPLSFYIFSFFRQFFRSVRKADYLAMRHGFITVHLAPGSKFDFQKYIERSLEDDFKVVVTISPTLWASAILFLLLNVKGWLILFWISIMPLITILAVGTKLHAIITIMALEIKERHAVIQGIPLVHLSDQHFWFGRPKFVLFLIHFTLFQNAFQLIYFLWIWYEFGLKSCFQDSTNLMIARICCGIAVQVLCSYITLPLYALVSQMGSHMKRSIFDDQTSKALKKWHRNVKKKNPKGSSNSPPNTSPKGSPRATPVVQIPHFKPGSNIALSPSPSRRRRHSDLGSQSVDVEALSTSAIIIPNQVVVQTDLLTGSNEQQLHAIKDPKDDEFTFINLSDP